MARSSDSGRLLILNCCKIALSLIDRGVLSVQHGVDKLCPAVPIIAGLLKVLSHRPRKNTEF